jgi:G3E family GTPase
VRDADDARTLVELLVDQIEFADVVVLNKVAAAGPARTAAARRIIAGLNPGARLIESDFCEVPLASVFDTGLFDFEAARTRPLWVKEMQGFGDHVPETEEYGISSFVWRARRPFDPARIRAVLTGGLPGVLRAKGWFWVANRPEWIMEFSLAGALADIRPMGRWWAAMPRTHWPPEPDAQARIRANWQAPFGDRRQELVFIGTALDRTAIGAALDACLVQEDARRHGPRAYALPHAEARSA